VVSEREADSDRNALFLVTLGSGKKRRLTTPPSGFVGDRNPAFSPDWRTLSFSRGDVNTSDLYLLRMTPEYEPVGGPKALTDRMPIKLGVFYGQAWGAGGKEIIVSMADGLQIQPWLWRVPLDAPGSSTRVEAAGFGPLFPAFSPAARRLAFCVRDSAVSSWILEDPGDGKTRPIARRR
jgi:Tol biopolymer transport system component